MYYGNIPDDIGLVIIKPMEMMFHQYMPISLKGTDKFFIPEHLEIFKPLITKAFDNEPVRFKDEYVYLTAKTLWVTEGYIGNRPGWHSDGFATDDINYIWSDRIPTEFLIPENGNGLNFDGFNCDDFYSACDQAANDPTWKIARFKNSHLLKLDPSMIHRSPESFQPGMRTFVKISISKDIYNLEGNASNPKLTINWVMRPRSVDRNHPSKV